MNQKSQFIEPIRKHFTNIGSINEHYTCYKWKGQKDILLKQFNGKTFPSIKLFEKRIESSTMLTAYVVVHNHEDELIANSFVNTNENNRAEVLSYYVAKDFRNKGVGIQFLELIEKDQRFLGIQHLNLFAFDNTKNFTYWQKILRVRKWKLNNTRMVSYTTPRSLNLRSQLWVNKSVMPHGYTVEPYNENTKQKLQELLAQDEWQKLNIKAVNPLQLWEHTLAYASLLLYKDNQIIGWVHCHIYDEKEIKVTSLFLHPNKAKGLLVPFIAEVIKRSKKDLPITMPIASKNQEMIKFVDRFLKDDETQINKLQEYIVTL